MFAQNLPRTLHFLAVAKAGNLSAAARELGISQPALSSSIRKLEEKLGFNLFDREHGFQVTDQGREFQIKAEGAVSRFDDLEREIESIRTGKLGVIRAACGPIVADGLIGPHFGVPRKRIGLVGRCGNVDVGKDSHGQFLGQDHYRRLSRDP